MKKLTIRFLVVSACLTVMAGVPAMAKGKQEMENPWVKPGTTPPLVPGTGMTVSCPDPLPQGTGKGVKLENQKEAFHIRLPANFDPRETYGVVVFISGPQNEIGCPGKWLPVLDAHKLIYIAPQNAGNKEPVGFRDARAVTSALLIKKYYHIDPARIYVAGYSGGARVAGMSAFKHPELWRGTIQSCGADYYKPVPRVAVTDEEFKKNPDWSRDYIRRISEKLGLRECQVYKWHWDQRKKEGMSVE